MDKQGPSRPAHGAGGKPGQTPGISAAEFATLKAQVTSLSKQLQEALAEKNQWNSVLRRWQDIGAVVIFALQGGGQVAGKIAWIDRYTIGILAEKQNGYDSHGEPTIIHKGAIATVSV